MIWPILAVVSLVMVQMAIAAACLYAYTRIRTQGDAAGKDLQGWSARLEIAATNADLARKTAETIEVEHFKKLRAQLEGESLALGKCRAEVAELTVKYDSLRKRQEATEKAEKRAARAAAPDVAAEDTQYTPEEIAAWEEAARARLAPAENGTKPQGRPFGAPPVPVR